MNCHFDPTVIDKYLQCAISDVQHRYRSWDHCFLAFSNNRQNLDVLALHLGFYLASWGMYRGSGGLLQKNHLVHEGAVKILLSDQFKTLKCNYQREVDEKSIQSILKLKKTLSDHYKGIHFTKKDKQQPISDTDTLLSKILLGTFACVPAYDRYLIAGIKIQGFKSCSFDEFSLHEIIQFIEVNKQQINYCQKTISDKMGLHYPVMKIVDMYFWQTGFDIK